MANTKKTTTKKDAKKTNKTITKEEKIKTTSEKEEKNISLETEEVAEILDENEKKKLNTNVLKRIWDIIFWLAFCALAFVWIVDFIHVNKGEEPSFCLKEETHEYDDGSVYECTGLGYKIYNYDRTSVGTGYEFGPFFKKMKDAE